MRVFYINAVPYGSTGRMMFSLADYVGALGGEVLTTSGFTWQLSDRRDHFVTSGLVEKYAHIQLAKMIDGVGLFSRRATRKLIRRIEEFKPDLIHMHTIHGWFVNLPMLFSYLKEAGVPVVWTLHDCWAFTGHCPHFEMIGCSKWKTGCYECPIYRDYPSSWVDGSKAMYERKKTWFTGVSRLTLVAPSEWLANNVRQSFLKDYPVRVINNGIDLSVFCPQDCNARERYGVRGQYMVLGVAYAWDERKGLDTMIELAGQLPNDYQIVLVGTDDRVDRALPDGIISIHRTQNQSELASLYAAADVFVNPTREDNFPTVNIEALASGCPVVTFDTGGSPEILDALSGFVVPKNDVGGLAERVRAICEGDAIDRGACVCRASRYSSELSITQYVGLYEELL